MTKLGCSADQVKRMTALELKSHLDRDSRGEFVLVDVRQPEEYAEGHIPGAILIPLGELEVRQRELERGKKIILYCRAGHRSMAGAIALCGLGFRDVYHLEGGIRSWSYTRLKGPPEVKPDLVSASSSHRDVLMLSIKLEKGSIEFYIRAARDVSSEVGKELFGMLAEVEEKHMRKVYNRAVKSLGRGSLPPWDDLRISVKADYMEGGIEIEPVLAEMPEQMENEMEALDIAVEREYRSYDFYQRASVAVLDYDTRAFFHKLATEERRHVDVILNRIAEVARR